VSTFEKKMKKYNFYSRKRRSSFVSTIDEGAVLFLQTKLETKLDGIRKLSNDEESVLNRYRPVPLTTSIGAFFYSWFTKEPWLQQRQNKAEQTHMSECCSTLAILNPFAVSLIDLKLYTIQVKSISKQQKRTKCTLLLLGKSG
jgi:hypothetical protein